MSCFQGEQRTNIFRWFTGKFLMIGFAIYASTYYFKYNANVSTRPDFEINSWFNPSYTETLRNLQGSDNCPLCSTSFHNLLHYLPFPQQCLHLYQKLHLHLYILVTMYLNLLNACMHDVMYHQSSHRIGCIYVYYNQ